MYQKVVDKLNVLRGLFPGSTALVDVLQQTFGQCSQPLEHNAPVTIETTLPANTTNAALSVSNFWNHGGTPDGSNGMAIHVGEGITKLEGPLWAMHQPDWMQFVLLEALAGSVGSTAPAGVTWFSPDNSRNPGTSVTVKNGIGLFSGERGDPGYARWRWIDIAADSGEWIIQNLKNAESGSVPADPAATCSHGTTGAPYFYSLSIDNLGSGGSCEELNGKTFLLTYDSACTWKIDGLSQGGTCDYDEIELVITQNGSDTRLTVTIYDDTDTTIATAYHTIPGHPGEILDGPFETWTWTTAGPPPDVTGPPDMVLTPIVPPQLDDVTCFECPDDKVPTSYLFTVSGMANGFCDTCTNWNGTYVLTRDNSASCFYTVEPHKSLGSSPCGAAPYWLERIDFFPDIGVLEAYGHYTTDKVATGIFALPDNCWQWFDEELPAVTTTFCDASSATWKITTGF